jgi:hypothetical protein
VRVLTNSALGHCLRVRRDHRLARRTSFIDDDISAHEVLAVESLDSAARFFIVVDFNETEPARLSRELVSY